MKLRIFIKKNLIYYRKSNTYIGLAIALLIAVIIGSLGVGDSVSNSLIRISNERLGQTDFVISSGERFLSDELAKKLKKELPMHVSPILVLKGILTNRENNERLNKVNVYGVDSTFFQFASLKGIPSSGIFVNQEIKNRIGLSEGISLLLNIPKINTITINSPFVNKEDAYIAIRDTVSEVLGDKHLGNFSLSSSQTAPLNIFLPRAYLLAKMGIDKKCNLLIMHSTNHALKASSIEKAINRNWCLEDAGFTIEPASEKMALVKADNIFIPDEIVKRLTHFEESIPYTSYFVNQFKTGNRTTPYSFIATSNLIGKKLKSSEIIISQWLSDDLQASIGDSVTLRYFNTGSLRKVHEDSAKFKVVGRVQMSDVKELYQTMPGFKGMADLNNCSDWKTDLPIDLNKIRDVDEKYWDDYKGTPKAFIGTKTAKELFKNKYGTCTGVYLKSEGPVTQMGKQFLGLLSPNEQGLRVMNIKEQNLKAAKNGIDFGSLFLSLNAFVIFSASILLYLIIRLSLFSRKNDLQTLNQIGIKKRWINTVYIAEILIIAICSSLIGTLGGYLIAKLITYAINTIWIDIVRTHAMILTIKPSTYIIGICMGLIVATLTTIWALRKNRKIIVTRNGINGLKRTSLLMPLAILLSILGTVSIFYVDSSISAYISGLPIMLAVLLVYQYVMRTASKPHELHGRLYIRNLQYFSLRSYSIIGILGFGLFIILSTGTQKIPLNSNSRIRQSGSGGYEVWSTLTTPIYDDLLAVDGLKKSNLHQFTNWKFLPLQILPGNDASCLNLNKIEKPALIGVPSKEIQENGSFQIAQSLSNKNQKEVWNLLQDTLADGSIPAIADQTVIQWGMMTKLGNKILYENENGHPLSITLIAGLKSSVFQGYVLIDRKFIEIKYPSYNYTNGLLARSPKKLEVSELNDLTMALRNNGPEIELTHNRLNKFSSVNNTYLIIFMLSGYLGMLLGISGLFFLLIRDLFERKNEITQLLTLGIYESEIRKQYFLEYGATIVVGICLGLLPVLPSIIFNQNIDASYSTIFTLTVTYLLISIIGTYLIIVKSVRRNIEK